MNRALRSLFDAPPPSLSAVVVPAAGGPPSLSAVVVPAAGGPVEHACLVCGAPAGFGFGVFVRRGIEGRWSCAAHRGEVAGMPK